LPVLPRARDESRLRTCASICLSAFPVRDSYNIQIPAGRQGIKPLRDSMCPRSLCHLWNIDWAKRTYARYTAQYRVTWSPPNQVLARGSTTTKWMWKWNLICRFYKSWKFQIRTRRHRGRGGTRKPQLTAGSRWVNRPSPQPRSWVRVSLFRSDPKTGCTTSPNLFLSCLGSGT
jgi:hypothetical protein